MLKGLFVLKTPERFNICSDVRSAAWPSATTANIRSTNMNASNVKTTGRFHSCGQGHCEMFSMNTVDDEL